MTQPEMLAHVKEMASKNNILLRLEAPNLKTCKAYRNAKPPRVITRPITSQHTYAIALHELGHCLSPESKTAGNEGKTILCEAEAWAWAIKTSRVVFDNKTKTMLGRALKTYKDHWDGVAKEGRGNLVVVFPPEGHVFYEMIEWAKPKAKAVRVLP
jgi:hypothetical protein